MENDKIFLLFGSTGDLGKYAAEYFLKQNYYRYYFFARNYHQIPSTNEKIDSVVLKDAANEEDIIGAFSKIEHAKGRRYYLLSTIGGYSGGRSLADTDMDEMKKMMNINFYSSFLIAKHFFRFIKNTKGGSICFVSALSSLTAEEGKAAYNISKSALNNLVETLALEGKGENLTANAVAPFAIDTSANREWIGDYSKLVHPEKICKTVFSLFEDENATGQIVKLK